MTVLTDVALPQVFLRGNATSSYTPHPIYDGISCRWLRRWLIASAGSHRFGQSGKPDFEYRFADHVRYIDEVRIGSSPKQKLTL
jgi:hypothetical protein